MRPTAAKALLRPFHIVCRSASSLGSRTSIAPDSRAMRTASAAVCSTSASGPSTSIKRAAPTSGQSTPVAALMATMARRSIISMAAGTIPAAMIRETACPASSVEGKVAKNVRVASALRKMRRTISVAMANVPSLPTTAPIRS